VRRRVTAIALLLVAAAVSSCGGSGVSHTSVKRVKTELHSQLKTTTKPGKGTFFVTPSGTCGVTAVYGDPELSLHKSLPTILLSPDHTVGIDIAPVVGKTSLAYCLKYAADALGWN
jgi:hypothetical protein